MKNQSFYAVMLTLLALITVAVWQFFSLVARSEVRDSYVANDERSFKRPTYAATPK